MVISAEILAAAGNINGLFEFNFGLEVLVVRALLVLGVVAAPTWVIFAITRWFR